MHESLRKLASSHNPAHAHKLYLTRKRRTKPKRTDQKHDHSIVHEPSVDHISLQNIYSLQEIQHSLLSFCN